METTYADFDFDRVGALLANRWSSNQRTDALHNLRMFIFGPRENFEIVSVS